MAWLHLYTYFLRCYTVLYFIRLGAHYKDSDLGSVGTEQDIGVAKIILHKTSTSPWSYGNDIALINLVNPADLGVGVGLVCLPYTGHQLSFDNVNKKCWITGWKTFKAFECDTSAVSLMQASVTLVSKQRCANAYPGKMDDSILCAGLGEGGVDICPFDSGGPLVCEFNGTWYLEGITNRYSKPGKYGVFFKVRKFTDWLSSKMYTVVPPTLSPQKQLSSSLGENRILNTFKKTFRKRDVSNFLNNERCNCPLCDY